VASFPQTARCREGGLGLCALSRPELTFAPSGSPFAGFGPRTKVDRESQ
jgi:hypothetical protein